MSGEYGTRCPRHPVNPVDRCPPCEALIAAEERAREDPDPGGADQVDEVRFERWLDEIGEA